MAHQALIQRAPFQRNAITPLQQLGLYQVAVLSCAVAQWMPSIKECNAANRKHSLQIAMQCSRQISAW